MEHSDPSSGMHGSDMDMDMDMPMMMTMYFYQTRQVKFLFNAFDVNSTSGYFSVILVAFIIGFTAETLSVVQSRLDQQITASIKSTGQKQRGKRLSLGMVYLLRVFASYLCMMSVMTYNVGILFAVVVGLCLSYFLMGFQPAEVIVVSNTRESTFTKETGTESNTLLDTAGNCH